MTESPSIDRPSDWSAEDSLELELRRLVEAPPVDPQALMDRVSPTRLSPGTVIDDTFAIERQLGRGGMGVVYLARHEVLDRPVAIKLCRRRPTPRQTERLLAEARAMAALVHPNVAVVHHAGTTDGQVYVVMEYVEGGTLRDWCEEREHGWSRIVERFVQAGRGLAAAHAKGFVHRDFKPDNVLVGLDGRVRVSDFGLVLDAQQPTGGTGHTGGTGRANETDSAESTLAGAGTPHYMAPEQRAGRAVGPAADQYALCVSLHEALYRPEPENPEGTRPAGLPRRIDAALERGLRADPGERHPDMAALLRRLEPPRRRGAWALAVVASTLCASGVTWWSVRPRVEPCPSGTARLAEVWNDERRAALDDAMRASAEGHAGDTRRLLDAGLETYARSWAETHDRVCADDGALAGGLSTVGLACLDEARAQLDQSLTTLESGGALVGERALRALYALPRLSRCREPEHLRVRASASTSVPTEAVAELRQALARVRALDLVGRPDLALERLHAVAERAAALDHRPSVAEARLLEGRLCAARACPPDETIDHLERASLLAEAAGADGLRAEIGAQLVYFVGVEQGRHQRALEWGHRTEAVVERLGALGHAEAGALFDSLGRVHLERGAPEPAEAALRRAESLKVETLGDDHPSTASTRLALGRAQQRRGRYDEAGRAFDLADAGYRRTLGPLHPESSQPLLARAELAEEQGDDATAEARLMEVVARWEVLHGPEHARLMLPLNALGRVRSRAGRHDDAVAAYARARRLAERALGPEHLQTAWARVNEAEGLRAAGAIDAAIETYTIALETMRAQPEHTPALDTEPRVGRAEALLAAGRLRAAEDDVVHVEGICTAHGCEPAIAGRAALARARLLASRGRLEDARTVAGRALEALPDRRRTHRLLRRAIRDWLDQNPAPATVAAP